MQIQNQKNSVNFTSQPLHFVNLKKLTNGVEDGVVRTIVSELEPNNPIDKPAISKIVEMWGDCPNLVHWLCKDFAENTNKVAQYFAIEKLCSGDLAKKIVGLMQVYPQKSFVTKRDNLILSTLATKPEFAKSNTAREMKDIGESLLGETFNIAKEKNIANVKIYATKSNYKFYSDSLKRAGLSEAEFGNPSEENLYELMINEKSFNKCTNYYKNKFFSDIPPSI